MAAESARNTWWRVLLVTISFTLPLLLLSPLFWCPNGLLQTSGYLGKSALRKVDFELVQEDMVDERLPGIKSFSKIRFLSRGNAVSAIVKNYVPLLEFSKAEGGQLAAEAFNARLQEEEATLEREASAARDGAGVLRTSLASIRQSKDTVNGMLGPELAGQGGSVHAVADAGTPKRSTSMQDPTFYWTSLHSWKPMWHD